MEYQANDDAISFYDHTRAIIEEYGHSVIGVSGDGTSPTFTYTIGLHDLHGFELIVTGIRPQFAHIMFHNISKFLKEGNTLDFNVPDDRWANLPVSFEVCNTELVKDYACQAFNYYDKDITVVQMVLSDQHGILPYQDGYDAAYMGPRQPLLYDKVVN